MSQLRRALAACLGVLALASCKSEKKDFERMKPEIDPIIADLSPLAAEFARVRGDGGAPDSTDPIRAVCEAAQNVASRTHFDVLMFRAGRAKETAVAFEDALVDLEAITTTDLSGDLVLIGRWDFRACERAFDKLCKASSALSAAARADDVSIGGVCKELAAR